MPSGPTHFLSTVQVGITSIAILNGIVGEAALAGPLALWLQSFGIQVEASRIASTALVVLIITYVTIVVGELVPKRIAQLDPERIACRVARPMQLLASWRSRSCTCCRCRPMACCGCCACARPTGRTSSRRKSTPCCRKARSSA
jgi:CBS domain containing-hemolysin-like protein